jgi:hypothetical protein
MAFGGGVLIKKVAFKLGGSDLIKRMAIGRRGLMRRVAFGGSDLIRRMAFGGTVGVVL